jgi:hypothetical protein
MMKYRDDYEEVLWRRLLFDRRAQEALRTMSTDFLKYCPADDIELSRRKGLVAIHLAYCEQAAGDPDAVLRVAAGADRRELSEGERRVLEYAASAAFLQLGRYADAVPGFRECAKWEGFRHRKVAHRQLIVALAKSGREREAQAAYADFVATHSPDPSELNALSAELGSTILDKWLSDTR